MKRDYKFNEFSNLIKGFIVVTILSRNLEVFMEKEFKELYKNAYIHLMFIKHVEGISQMELSLLTGTNKSTLVRNLADLISKDYVIKKTSSRANENELYLTEKGLKTVEVIQNWIQDRELEIENETKNFDNMKENVSSYMLKVIDLYSK
ncbi:MarR family transcriptional regulator [Spiroplasma tabanidicola]|uniref:MarR family transcriptional regulator n=1 Tax=Spiroplasma tabanidicola TaxID=324079 RepID=A0A6I6C4U4_9MOLU|nr:MarR family transcriptional regulator [Spiroplasma tabanidicola]QGS51837.1 MarR family transcriptional regulator [Spiroplasma tabanidicola]